MNRGLKVCELQVVQGGLNLYCFDTIRIACKTVDIQDIPDSLSSGNLPHTGEHAEFSLSFSTTSKAVRIDLTKRFSDIVGKNYRKHRFHGALPRMPR